MDCNTEHAQMGYKIVINRTRGFYLNYILIPHAGSGLGAYNSTTNLALSHISTPES